jgi:glutathione S-transferase
MNTLYFAPGACSFVPHAGLEIIKAATGEDFEPKLVKLHKGEQKAPEYLALNPNGQVPLLVVDGKPLNQIVAICEYLDRRHPDVGLLPRDSWARAQALSQLAWMNNTAHPTFTHFFRPGDFTDDETAQKAVKAYTVGRFRKCLERIQDWVKDSRAFWFGDKPTFHDAYAFTLMRWGGFAGIDPQSLPAYYAYVQRVMACPPIAAAIARERIGLDTYKPAA